MRQHEPAIRCVVEPAGCVLPAREPESGTMPSTQPPAETASGVFYAPGTHTFASAALASRIRGGERDADDIDGREPASCTLTRGPHPISLHQRNRNQRDQAEHDQQRNQQQRHNTAYDIAQGAKGCKGPKVPRVPGVHSARGAAVPGVPKVPECQGAGVSAFARETIVRATARPRRSRVAAKAGGR